MAPARAAPPGKAIVSPDSSQALALSRGQSRGRLLNCARRCVGRTHPASQARMQTLPTYPASASAPKIRGTVVAPRRDLQHRLQAVQLHRPDHVLEHGAAAHRRRLQAHRPGHHGPEVEVRGRPAQHPDQGHGSGGADRPGGLADRPGQITTKSTPVEQAPSRRDRGTSASAACGNRFENPPKSQTGMTGGFGGIGGFNPAPSGELPD